MPEIETISWRVLTGNKFIKTLDPAMDSSEGYLKNTSIRRIGDAGKSYFRVRYDRSYMIEYLGRLICRPLFVFGKEKVLNLVAEAWDNYYGITEAKQAEAVASE